MLIDIRSIKISAKKTLIDKKNPLLAVVITFFSTLYVLKQTTVDNKIISIMLASAYIVILALTIKDALSFIRENLWIFLYCLISLSFAIGLIGDLESSILSTSKIILFFILFVIDRNNNYLALKSIIVGFSAGLIIAIILNLMHYTTSITYENGVWRKESYGFFNPNIAPIFLASIVIGCSLFNKNLANIAACIVILSAFFFKLFSRSEMLIAIYFLLVNTLSILRINIENINKFIIIIILSYALFFYGIYFGIFNYFYSELNYLNEVSSNRFYLIYKLAYIVNYEGPILVAKLSDGILYDFLFPLGFPFLFIFVHRLINIFFKNYDLNMSSAIVGVSIFGLFEGVLNKITPIGIVFFHIIFYEKNRKGLNNFQIFFNKFISNSKINLLKLQFGFLLCVLFYFWTLPVYLTNISFNDSVNLTSLDGVVNSSLKCNKLYLSYLSSDLGDHEIAVISNQLNSNKECSDQLIALLAKDFDDLRNPVAHPIYKASTIELNKKNFLRYITSFSIILFGFIFLIRYKNI